MGCGSIKKVDVEAKTPCNHSATEILRNLLSCITFLVIFVVVICIICEMGLSVIFPTSIQFNSL